MRIQALGQASAIAVQQRRRGGRGAAVGKPQLGQLAVPAVAFSAERVEDPLPDRGHRIEPVGAELPDRRADRRPVGLRHVGHQIAGLPLLQRDGPGAHVEEREDADHRPARLFLRAGMAAQVIDPVREHHALGRPGAAGGEEQHVRIGLFGRVLEDPGRRVGRGARRSSRRRTVQPAGTTCPPAR